MFRNENPTPSLFQMVTIEELVPEDHFLRQLDAAVDFSFIKDRVRHLYCEDNGRPPIDPELVLRMFVLSYLYDIPENRLCDEIRMHAGYRWFCRLDFHDPVPDRTTLVKIRRHRWGPDGVFHDVMNHIVKACIEAGFVSGDVLAVDGTLVKARAATRSLEQIKPAVSLDEYCKRLEAADEADDEQNHSDDDPPGSSPSTRKAGDPNFHGQKFTNATHRSKTDPDARLYSKGARKEAELRFMVHQVMDTKSCVILQTQASRCSGTAEREMALDMLSSVKKQGLNPRWLLGDGGYTATSFLGSVKEMNVKPLVPIKGDLEPVPAWKRRTFNLGHMRRRKEKIESVAIRNEARLLRGSRLYEKTYRLRIRLEHRFAEAKEWHGMDRARGYGLMAMDIQAQLTATVQNLKRLVRWKRRRPTGDGNVMAQAPKGRSDVGMAAFKPFKNVLSRVITKMTCESSHFATFDSFNHV